MGWWQDIKNMLNSLRKKNKQELLQEGSDLVVPNGNAFEERLKKQAEENLTTDQLREKFARYIGVDEKLLNLPGVKELLFTIGSFPIITSKSEFDVAKKSDKKDYKIENGSDGSIVISYEAYQGSDMLEIFQNELVCTVKKTIQRPSSISEEKRQYDKKTRIEIFREEDLTLPTTGVYTKKTSIRGADSLEKADYKYISGQGSRVDYKEDKVIDLSKKDGDISTLDNCMLGEPYDKYEDSEIRKKRILERIAHSKYSKGCYEYAGIPNPDLQNQL